MMKKLLAILMTLTLMLTVAVAEEPATEMLVFGANPTGYSWTAIVMGGDSVTIDNTEGEYLAFSDEAELDGEGGMLLFTLTAVKPGETIIVFSYARDWEPDSEIERVVVCAVVDEEMALSIETVTDSGMLSGTVTSVDAENHAVLMNNDRHGEIEAVFAEDMALPVEGENIVIYTNGVMTMSLPGIVNVIAWETVPGADARTAE